MSGYRSEIEASAGPARRSLVGRRGRGQLLVRVTLHDGPGCEDPQPAVFTDLDPPTARDFAFRLLSAAEHAEHLTRHANQRENEL